MEKRHFIEWGTSGETYNGKKLKLCLKKEILSTILLSVIPANKWHDTNHTGATHSQGLLLCRHRLVLHYMNIVHAMSSSKCYLVIDFTDLRI